jgi:hypothetical protein
MEGVRSAEGKKVQCGTSVVGKSVKVTSLKQQELTEQEKMKQMFNGGWIEKFLTHLRKNMRKRTSEESKVSKWKGRSVEGLKV